MQDPIVGIDLGTSNSVVAHADEVGVVKVLPDDGGYKIHPSVVSFHPNGGVVVGAGAKQRKVIDPSNTIYSVKRLIGRAYDSPEVEVLKKRGFVDETRMAVSGWSYGGYMTTWLLGHYPVWKAAIAGAAVTLALLSYGLAAIGLGLGRLIWSGRPVGASAVAP